MTAPLVFVDTETTHLDRHLRRAWEIALIVRAPGIDDTPLTWFVAAADLDLPNADPQSLKFGKFYDRHPDFMTPDAWTAASSSGQPTMPVTTPEAEVARRIEQITRGATLAGAVPSFDEETLDALLRRNGLRPSWGHRIIDVRVYAAGVAGVDPTWGFNDACTAFGVTCDETVRHTAMGDALLARDLYDAARAGKLAGQAAP